MHWLEKEVNFSRLRPCLSALGTSRDGWHPLGHPAGKFNSFSDIFGKSNYIMDEMGATTTSACGNEEGSSCNVG